MNIDALTSAALENLQKEALPKVVSALAQIHSHLDLDSSTTQSLRSTLSETTELLNLILDWTTNKTGKVENDTQSDVMTDEDAMFLLAEMDEPSIPANANDAMMSDDDARKLLAEMDSPTPEISSQTKSPQKNIAPEAVDASDVPEISEWESNDFASDPEMMNDFTSNCADIMQTLDETVLKLEQNPTNKETIEEIFRAAHTLKGAAGMFGFRAIERVMHRMENLFDNVRRGKLVPTSDTIDAVFAGLDCLKKLLAAVLAQSPSGMKTAPVVRSLELAALGQHSGASRTKEASGTHSEKIENTSTKNEVNPQSSNSVTNKKKPESNNTIRVDLERLDALVNLIGELVIDRTRFLNIEESMRIQAPQMKITGSMTETLQQFGRHMNEIQDIIMKVRMVPIGSVFNKYPRIVRDLARQLEKQIDLVIEGEDTEFDKTLVEQIADPLVHLIRNACDHGIETPEARASARKSQNGTVTLSARQEGNQIIIQIADNGKGMDPAKIRAKGIEKGLVKPEQQMTESEIFNLIFEPGFSTAEKVTTVSGRGVGMDVVRKQIAKLKGTVEINSAPGKGSTITIHLPLTLAIVQSLLVEVEEETLAIPLNSVIESIRIKPQEIQSIGDSQMIKLRDHPLPILYLDKILGLQAKQSNDWNRNPTDTHNSATLKRKQDKREERLYVVVIGAGERKYGVVVDSLLSQQEMVIKPLGPLMRGIPCVAGGAVLGNGEVVLVMDTLEIDALHRKNKNHITAA
jgi:two-component system chemotaxis sensor kinase CheA